MKRLLVFAVLAVLTAAPAIQAQTSTVAFGWDSHIVQRVGTTVTPQGQFRVDTNRFDMTIPLSIGGSLVIRGVGQVFAPRHFWRFYDPYYNGDSADPAARDQEYVDQFKGVQDWVLDSVRMAVFHNSDNPNPASPGQIDFYRMDTDYRNDRNSDSGLTIPRTQLESKLVHQEVLDRDALINTVTENGAIVPTSVKFDPPLEFTKEESVMIMYINDFATPVSGIGEGDTREWQRVIGYVEYQGGTGDSLNRFRNPIPNDMVHGMIMSSVGGVDTVESSYRALVFGPAGQQQRYLANFNVLWFGVVNLDETDLPMPIGSVRYHFGYDASEQGLAEVTPNPVRDQAVIPFSLTKTATVNMDLYTADGRHVMTMLKDKRYIAGKYSIEMNASELESGSYLIRMTADDSAYSMKFVVTK